MIDKHTATLFAGDTAIDVMDATLTLDAEWSPYAQASVTIADPSREVYDSLDPLRTARARLTFLRTFAEPGRLSDLTNRYSSTGATLAKISADVGGPNLATKSAKFTGTPFNNTYLPPSSKSLELMVLTRTRDLVAGTVRLALASDEALLQSYALTGNAPVTFTAGSIRELVATVLARIGAVPEYGDEDGPIDPDGAVWEPGVSALDFLDPHLKASGLQLWCDSGRWFLLAPDAYEGAQLTTLTKGTDVLSAERETSTAGDYFDAVVVAYEWDNGTTTESAFYYAATSATPLRVRRFDYRTAPGRYAQQAAEDLLRRGPVRADTWNVVGLANYDTAPRDGLRLTLDSSEVNGIIRAVTFDLARAEMRLTPTRMIES
ncbi:hypothetical protein [Herbiconiux sp. VKM Ac-2851]|uniref:hypothetical protein n=1 Tax=Herbiconiux sp. VKM Ac-2851 TaxID=2739025 RepID=UPI0015679B4F|nr:hypothetical protein [Herbiconiux sp. VKM Ac-2851]NQX34056.1 hypothetical protein [Herbiconiux sp. VKM Ac-2851]